MARSLKKGPFCDHHLMAKVEDVATINKKPITKRHGMRLYKTQAKKKAIVKLAKENTITYFKEV